MPENRSLLEGIYEAHQDVIFVEIPFDLQAHYGAVHWHNLQRIVGLSYAKQERVLFLDVDEIMEGSTFLKWLNGFDYRNYEAIQLSCYWYFREPTFRAKNHEHSPLFVAQSAITNAFLTHPYERAGSFVEVTGCKLQAVMSLENQPMCHHYSWVRTKEQMLRKVRSWGHREEWDWQTLVEKEFSGSFSGRDFVHGYAFDKVPKLLKESEYEGREKSVRSHVHRLTAKERNKIESLFIISGGE